MKVILLRQAALDLLVKDIERNYDKYKSSESWIKNYYYENGVVQYTFDSGIEVEDVNLYIGDANTDLENIKLIYEAYKDKINLIQATDLRLWAYLTHEVYWQYMRVRWPLEAQETISRIKTRYFYDRAQYVRNGLARLFWTGYMTYDPDNENHYEYTEFVLSDQDIAVAALERQMGRSKNLVLGTLQALKEAKNSPMGFDRDDVREFFVRLNQHGGVSLLDSYSREDALFISREIVDSIQKLPTIENGKTVSLRLKTSGRLLKYKVEKGKFYLGNQPQKSEPKNVLGKKKGRTLKVLSQDAIILDIE